MRFRVLKSGFDGISGGDSRFDSIDEVLRDINFYRGWDSREQLHDAIRKWAVRAEPGSVFTTQVTGIVAYGVGDGVRYGDACDGCGQEDLKYEKIVLTDAGHIEQEISCPECNRRWKDIFTLAERRVLEPGK
jgi:hypothetical protein